jgi:trehalose/maltose hydrolase-like predicted phosphorylase
MMEPVLGATKDPSWVLSVDSCDLLCESNYESRFAISNGFLGVRAFRAVNRFVRSTLPARTYVAGLFDTPSGERHIPELVRSPDWQKIQIALADGPLSHNMVELSSHRMTLDMRRGMLVTACRLHGGNATDVRVRTLHLVSGRDRSVGLQLIQFDVENGAAEITLEAAFEGLNLDMLRELSEQDFGLWKTERSEKHLAIAASTSLSIDGHERLPTDLGHFKWSWNWKTVPGQVVCFARTVVIMRGETSGPDVGHAAKTKLLAAKKIGWRGIVAEHEAAWAYRWQSSDVEIKGDDPAQRALRFAIYHLNAAANPTDERVSIGARALTGDDYLGHVFWDTEIFLLPFYTLTWPEAARALLMYRFHMLDGARGKAADMGWRGALYAWESADTGAETTPEQVIGPDRQVIAIFTGKQEQHISADVAYAVWQYWQATADDKFLLDAGAEILLETARFWSSRAEREADGFRHIRGVIGPDEYHEHIDDNAFTNVMARWNIRRALEVAALLSERWPERWTHLSSQLDLAETELEHWREVAETMATGLDRKTGLFEQFAGFFALDEIDLANYAGRSVPMDVVLGRERTQKSQVIKQSDVVALLALLPEEFAGETGAENYRYYEPRCGHGSSLSRAMHARVAARLGYSEAALRYLQEASAIDLADTHVAIGGGVHIAALGGIWQTAVFGFAGLSIESDGISLDPKMPGSWLSLSFSVQWRHRRLKIKIEQGGQVLDAALESGEPMKVSVRHVSYELSRDHALRIYTGRAPFSRTWA